MWEYTLTGKIRPQDISPDNSALSERIADLSISKVQHGKLHDATQRAWFIKLYDMMGRSDTGRGQGNSMMRLGRGVFTVAALAAGLVCGLSPAAQARTQVGNICTVYGQKETPVIGIGLVVGLNRTGDGSKNAPAMRALASTLRYLNNPIESAKDLADATNVAMVAISATIPKEGASRGQRLDCYVTSTFGAKSLKGGRLLISPIRMPNVGDTTVVGLASGPIVIEDPEMLTSARIPGGIVLERDFRTSFIDRTHGNKVTLIIDPAHATFGVAWHIAEQINNDVYPGPAHQAGHRLGPDRIEVLVPELYRDDPVAFLAWLLKIDVMSPQTEARVSINTKSKTVVIHGDVQISPVVISHKNLKVEVAGTTGEPAPFAAINSQGQDDPQQLDELLRDCKRSRSPTTTSSASSASCIIPETCTLSTRSTDAIRRVGALETTPAPASNPTLASESHLFFLPEIQPNRSRHEFDLILPNGDEQCSHGRRRARNERLAVAEQYVRLEGQVESDVSGLYGRHLLQGNAEIAPKDAQ